MKTPYAVLDMGEKSEGPNATVAYWPVTAYAFDSLLDAQVCQSMLQEHGHKTCFLAPEDFYVKAEGADDDSGDDWQALEESSLEEQSRFWHRFFGLKAPQVSRFDC